MSATRRTSRLNRATLSLPYVRTTKKPVSHLLVFPGVFQLKLFKSWSLSGFLRSLNPLRSHSSTDDDRLSSDEESDSDNQEREEQILPSPGPSLFRREQQVRLLLWSWRLRSRMFKLTQNIPANGSALPPPPPPTNKRPRTPQRQENTSKSGFPSVEFTFKASSSPSQNLDTVSNFLAQHANVAIPREHIYQMVSLIQQSKPGMSSFNSLQDNKFMQHEQRNLSASKAAVLRNFRTVNHQISYYLDSHQRLPVNQQKIQMEPTSGKVLVVHELFAHGIPSLLQLSQSIHPKLLELLQLQQMPKH